MSNESIARVHYFERQYLRTQDFVDEQTYHLALRRRHNLAHHRWGIVEGLQLVLEEGGLFITAGMAVDGYGRELVLAQKQPLSSEAFSDKGSNILEVWLVYNLLGSDRAEPGYNPCSPADGASFYRWQEQPLTRLTVPDLDYPNHRQPKTVPEGDLSFGPERQPPDDPQNEWPVYLGSIQRNPDDTYSPNMSERPYVGLVGEEVVAPSGLARLQLGPQSADDPDRFAVYTGDTPVATEKGPPKLAIKADGQIAIATPTTIYGNLTVAGGYLELQAGVSRDPQTPPWSIYRVETPGGENELRIEMAATPVGTNRVVIGSWHKADSTGPEAFQPCLTIADDCTVTVGGNLVIKGQLIEEQAEARVRGQFTPEAKNFMISGVMSAIGGASALLPRFYRSEWPQPAPAPVPAPPASPLSRIRISVEEVVQNLAAGDDQQLTEFVNQVKAQTDLYRRLRESLGE